MAGVRVSWEANQLGLVHSDLAGLAEAEPLVLALRQLGFEPELSEAPGEGAGRTAE